MKTKEELTALKNEVETLSQKLSELSEDELKEVAAGWKWGDNWGDEGYFHRWFIHRNTKDGEDVL